MKAKYWEGCIWERFGNPCNLNDTTAEICEKCIDYLHPRGRAPGTVRAAPKSAEQVREEYFEQLKRSLKGD